MTARATSILAVLASLAGVLAILAATTGRGGHGRSQGAIGAGSVGTLLLHIGTCGGAGSAREEIHDRLKKSTALSTGCTTSLGHFVFLWVIKKIDRVHADR